MTRHSSYKQEYDNIAYKLALLGLTDEKIAEFFAISERTINYWKNKHPSFLQSLKKGKLFADSSVVESLYNRAIGAKITVQQAFKLKETIYENGKKVNEIERLEFVDLVQEVPPDTTACIFWLKNRQSAKWRDKIDTEFKAGEDTSTREAYINWLKNGCANAD